MTARAAELWLDGCDNDDFLPLRDYAERLEGEVSKERCTCDDIGDGRCPLHGRESELQNLWLEAKARADKAEQTNRDLRSELVDALLAAQRAEAERDEALRMSHLSSIWHRLARRFREQSNVAEARADKAEEKSSQYADDWYAAKSEFGTAMAKATELRRKAEAERDEARREVCRVHRQNTGDDFFDRLTNGGARQQERDNARVRGWDPDVLFPEKP